MSLAMIARVRGWQAGSKYTLLQMRQATRATAITFELQIEIEMQPMQSSKPVEEYLVE